MTALLAAYREEDVPLYPSVFVLPAVSQLAALAPATKRLVVGTEALTTISAPTILKNCAPLAQNGWSIFVGKSEPPTQFEYGVFRSLAHTFATSAVETMVQDAGDSPVLVIRNRGHLVVELRNAKNQVFTASLTSALAAESHFVQHIGTFVEALTSEASSPTAVLPFKPYASRFLADVLQRCHGTLCAVHRHQRGAARPDQFSKSIWLKEPLQWLAAHSEAVAHQTAESLSSLQAIESLISGMIHSDGVVIFGTDGSILGYRAFLNSTDGERQQQETEGGGRLRTYALMRGRLGGDFRAVFFRSQDGATKCDRAAT